MSQLDNIFDVDRSDRRFGRVAVYFTALEVKNIRCFGDDAQRLELSDDAGKPSMVTILCGDNSAGKTTLLQLLASAEPIGTTTTLWVNGQTEWLKSPRLSVYHTLDKRFASMVRGSMEGDLKLCFREELSTETKSASVAIGESHIGVTRNLDELAPPICFGYGATRGISSTDGNGSDGGDAAASLFLDGVKLVDAEEWLSALDYSASKASEIQPRQIDRLNRVRNILVSILPEVTDIRFTQPTEESPNPRVEFKTPYGWVPLRALGHGYRSMISWMVDFASRMVDRYPDGANPLAEPAVVLVDEIDLHLHPKWQRQIIPHLMKLFPRTQFIVTAHSPLIVQAALDPNIRANVAVLRREGDHVVIDNNPESIRAWTVDQILTSPIYDLPTARPASLDEKLRRRKEILSKAALDDQDRKELQSLEAEIGTLPSGESADDAQRLLKLTEETQELLKKYKGTGS